MPIQVCLATFWLLIGVLVGFNASQELTWITGLILLLMIVWPTDWQDISKNESPSTFQNLDDAVRTRIRRRRYLAALFALSGAGLTQTMEASGMSVAFLSIALFCAICAANRSIAIASAHHAGAMTFVTIFHGDKFMRVLVNEED